MNATQFCKIGEALRGPAWQRAIAADLGRDERTVRHYAAGTRPIPATVRKALLAAVYAHAEELQRLARLI